MYILTTYKLQLKRYKIIRVHRVHQYHTSKDPHTAWIKESGAPTSTTSTLLVPGDAWGLPKDTLHNAHVSHSWTLPAKAHLDAAAGEGALPLRLLRIFWQNRLTKFPEISISDDLCMKNWAAFHIHFIFEVCQTFGTECEMKRKSSWQTTQRSNCIIFINFQFFNSHYSRIRGSVTHAIQNQRGVTVGWGNALATAVTQRKIKSVTWNSFRPVAFLPAVAQVTSGFWWTGVCVVSLQCQGLKRLSATHDTEHAEILWSIFCLSLKVSSRLEIWQTQTLLLAHTRHPALVLSLARSFSQRILQRVPKGPPNY